MITYPSETPAELTKIHAAIRPIRKIKESYCIIYNNIPNLNLCFDHDERFSHSSVLSISSRDGEHYSLECDIVRTTLPDIEPDDIHFHSTDYHEELHCHYSIKTKGADKVVDLIHKLIA